MRRTGGWTTTLLGLGLVIGGGGALVLAEMWSGPRDETVHLAADEMLMAQPPVGEPKGTQTTDATTNRSAPPVGIPQYDTAAMSTPCRRRSRSCMMHRKPRLLHQLLVPLLLMTLAACQRPQTASSVVPTRPRTLPTPPAELTLPERLTRYDPHPSGQITSVDKGQLTQLTDAYKQAVAAVAKLNGRIAGCNQWAACQKALFDGLPRPEGCGLAQTTAPATQATAGK